MKVKVTIILDTELGEYEMLFHNLGNPGEMIEYTEINVMLNNIFNQVDDEISNSGMEGTDKVVKIIH